LAYAESVVARIRAEEERHSMVDEVLDESRDKWVRAAWAIKARLEGLTEEARSLGKTEVRTEHVDLEIRETGDGMTFEGYAAVFNSPSQPLPFVETIKPGAFKRSLQGRHRMMLLWNHNASEPLASTRNGSLKLVEDARGLKVTARLANTQTGRDVAELIRSGVIDAMSFGFQVKKDSWSADGNNRTLEEVAVHEVSLTSFPAYEGTAGTTSVREKRDIDADQLADSLMKLESGEELDAEQAKVISEVVAKLTKTDEVEEVEEVEGDILALKKKKLDLLMKEAV
jgi:HK97 family phage prohead protease